MLKKEKMNLSKTVIFAVLVHPKYDPELMTFSTWTEVLAFVNDQRDDYLNPQLAYEDIVGSDYIEINEDSPQVSLYLKEFEVSFVDD